MMNTRGTLQPGQFDSRQKLHRCLFPFCRLPGEQAASHPEHAFSGRAVMPCKAVCKGMFRLCVLVQRCGGRSSRSLHQIWWHLFPWHGAGLMRGGIVFQECRRRLTGHFFKVPVEGRFGIKAAFKGEREQGIVTVCRIGRQLFERFHP